MSNRERSDQQLHRDEIKVVEACGVRHLVFLQTEASVAANAFGGELPPPLSGLKPLKMLPPCVLYQQEVCFFGCVVLRAFFGCR